MKKKISKTELAIFYLMLTLVVLTIALKWWFIAGFFTAFFLSFFALLCWGQYSQEIVKGI